MAEDSEKLAQLVVRLQSGDMAAFDEIYILLTVLQYFQLVIDWTTDWSQKAR